VSKDYYKLLGVDKSATQDEVKKAFKKLAMQHHPDRPGGDEKKFKEINEAFQVLGDAEKRAKYDQFGADFDQQGGFGGASWEDFMRAARSGQGGFGGANFGGVDFGDIFGDIFGFGGGGGRGQSRGRDIQVDAEIDFKEAAFGVEKEISLRINPSNQVFGHQIIQRIDLSNPKPEIHRLRLIRGSGVSISDDHLINLDLRLNIGVVYDIPHDPPTLARHPALKPLEILKGEIAYGCIWWWLTRCGAGNPNVDLDFHQPQILE